jgi:hypothetical protein
MNRGHEHSPAADLAQRVPEMALLLAATRTRTPASLPELLNHPIDWQRFLALAESHHVTPLVYKTFASMPDAAVPESVRRRLHEAFTANTRRVMFLMAQLIRLIDLFSAEGIDAVPFKGPVLAQDAYGNLALRQCGDLDVLIRPEHVPRAKRLLLDRGYEMVFPNCTPSESAFLAAMDDATERRYLNLNCEYHFHRRSDLLNIDLHWRINPPEMALDYDERGLFERLIAGPAVGGREIPRISPADNLLILCFNGAKDCWMRLDRICDVAELLQSKPPHRFDLALEMARRIGAMRMLLVGAALARELLEAPLSDALTHAIAADPIVDAMLPVCSRGLIQSMDISEMRWQLQVTMFNLRLRERLRDRIAYLRGRLAPTVGDWTSIRLPAALTPLYLLLRPLRIAKRIILAALGRNDRTGDEPEAPFRPRSTAGL